jgi:hypothetical protein
MKNLSSLEIQQVVGGNDSIIELKDGRKVYADGNGGYSMSYHDAYNLDPSVIAPCVMVPVIGSEGNFIPLRLA